MCILQIDYYCNNNKLECHNLFFEDKMKILRPIELKIIFLLAEEYRLISFMYCHALSVYYLFSFDFNFVYISLC